MQWIFFFLLSMTTSSANQLVLQAKFALALKLGIFTSLSIQGKENMCKKTQKRITGPLDMENL